MQYQPTVSQRLIWLDVAISGKSAKYNIGGYAVLEGQLSYAIFEQAIRSTLRCQEVYSTIFREEEGVLLANLEDVAANYIVDILDLSMKEDPRNAALSWMEDDFARPFAMEGTYLFSFKLLKLSDELHFWYAKIHHLISDGWSFRLLMNQTAEFYSLPIAGQDGVYQYKYSEYALEDEGYYQSGAAAPDREYWLNEYKDLPAELFKPLPHRQVGMVCDNSETLYLAPGTKRMMQELADEIKVSLFQLVIGILLVYFGRTRLQQDIAVGVPVLNRTKKVYRNTAGVFMNLLSLKFSVRPEDTFLEFLARIKQHMSASLRHQRYQYGNLASDLQLPPGSLLYDIRVSYEDFDFSSSFGDLKASAIALSNHTEADKLAIYLRDYNDQGFDVRFVYDTAYFQKEMIRSICRSLEFMVMDLRALKDSPIRAIGLLSGQQRQAILSRAAGPLQKRTGFGFKVGWEHNVLQYGGNIAVSVGGASFSYREIDVRASVLASVLREKKAAGHRRLALLLPRNEKMIIGMLGSIMAGITYIPLDPEYPAQRLLHVLGDADCRLLLVAGQPDNLRPGDPVTERAEVLDIDELTAAAFGSGSSWSTFEPDGPCYIIYTSGTTGIPKGVVITTASFDDYVSTFGEYFRVGRRDVVLQQASVGFDASVEEIFPILAAGGRLHIAEDRRDIASLPDLIEAERISIVSTSPLVVKFLDTHLLPPCVRVIISGGDVLRPSYIKNLLRQSIAVFNTYGPTESTVCATYHRAEENEDPIPVGRPIVNREVYVLDDQLQLQPPGVEGHIYLGGMGLAVGYLNDRELTARRFIDHPWKKAGKLYDTGDKGILQEDGTLQFTGRRDDQLKYRGYRLEAGEIEKVILAHSGVDSCLVMVREYRHDPLLVAYVKYGQERSRTLREWRQLVRGYLPDYMIPEVWIAVEQWPLSASGKVDKNLLSPVEAFGMEPEEEDRAPVSQLEQAISLIWEDILGRKIPGVNRSFFESGGHSLNVGQLINRYYKDFGVKLSFREVFQHTTIGVHAELIGSKRSVAYDPIKKIAESADYAVSDGQRRLWLLSHWEENAQAYCLSGQVLLGSRYDAGRMEEAIGFVISRHEILRTIFRINAHGELRQVVLSAADVPFRLDYLAADGADAAGVEAYIRQQAAAPFDPGKGPLLRAGLIRLAEDSCVFHYSMHHIISDGWSMELLLKEILVYHAQLNNKELPDLTPLPIQYKDYSAWQQEGLLHEELALHKNYWLQNLSGNLPVFQMPPDHRRPPVRTSRGYLYITAFDGELTEGLRSLCGRNQATLFMGLLGVLSVLGMRYTDQEELIVGTVVAGRNHCELEEQIGYYANTLALRVRCRRADSFSTLLQEIRNITLGAYEHQDYPFDRLVDDLGLEKDLSRSPLFDILLLLQNQHDSRDELYRSFGVGDMAVERDKSVMYDLVLNFFEINDGLQLRLEFNTDLYSVASITGMVESFKNVIGSVAVSPDEPVGRIAILSDAGKNRVQKEFNDTGVPYPSGETIVSLFASQVSRAPDQPAVIAADKSLTYRELDQESDRLARRLRRKGVGTGALVPIRIPRSTEMIVGILGILKAGAAYVPIDPAYPPERIAFICADTGAQCLVTSEEHGVLPEGLQLVYPDQEVETDMDVSLEPLPDVYPYQLAYVIYTSGSTGTPKGVMIEHGSVVNLGLGQADLLHLRPGLRTLQFSSFGFDASCYEIFNTLLSQGTLVIPFSEDLLSVDLFLDLIKKYHVQLAVLPPSFYSAFLREDLTPLETVVSAGEPLNVEAGRAIQRQHIRLINAYGPTEITVCASLTSEPILEDDRVTIGRPVPNVRIYILDSNKNLLPVGVPGELYIGGPGLARGYLNKPALTADCFIPDPYGGPQDLLYRSRDLGKWLPDGNIEYLGRADEQVKIRGYRIEPEEIEHALVRLPGISLACVLLRTRDDGERFLAAYVKTEKGMTIASLRRQLSEKLPHYMIPGVFVQVDEMPVTSNGKTDKRRLAELDVMDPGTGVSYVAPKNDIESALVRIYEEVLQRRPISVKDNFFDLGGNSMLLIRIRAALQRELNVRLNIRELYRALTIEELADTIAALEWMQKEQASDETQKEEEFFL